LTETAASLPRRIASMAYDALLLLALLFVAGLVFMVATDYPKRPHLRSVLQLLLLAVSAAYFVGFWLRGGQTLAMKTWRLRLIRANGARVDLPRALLRFVLAAAGLAAFGASIVWALFDRDGQFLHDRLAGTRIVLA
jgi:uncharacterized RDD family membrane protein YckC